MKKKIPSILKEIRSFKPPEIVFGYHKPISYSQLSMYNECPKKWSLQYREGHKQFTSSIHTVFGTAMHEVIQHYLTVMYEKNITEADKLNTSELFEEKLREEYAKQYILNNKQHFSNPVELREFYDDGVEIIREFAKKKGKYFSKRGWHLVGCETHIMLPPSENHPNILFQGYLDVVLYHEPTNKFRIIDIKTSRQGWSKYQKSDQNKQLQLTAYKKYFSEQFNIPRDDIEVEFFIVKRKTYDSEEYDVSRLQSFIPASGKVKMNKVEKTINKFIEGAFDENGFKDVEHQPTENNNCKWCPFLKTHLCSATF